MLIIQDFNADKINIIESQIILFYNYRHLMNYL